MTLTLYIISNTFPQAQYAIDIAACLMMDNPQINKVKKYTYARYSERVTLSISYVLRVTRSE